MKHRYNFVLAAMVVASVAQAQPGPFLQADLQFATIVCSDTLYSLAGQQTGMGDVDDLDVSNHGCQVGNERQSAWMHFSAATGGTIGFTIQPTITASDYDFAVWGPFSDVPQSMTSVPVRCSYAAGTGGTGLNSSSSDLSEGAGGDRFVRSLDVLSGERYVLLVNNFSQNGIDFTLVWDLQDGATLECLPPTEAAFSISENLIQPGGTVDLVDLSTNFPYAWVWDLPGGSPATSYDQNPQGVMYADPGCYDVSLTAYNAAGESTLSAVCLVQVESTTGLRASDQDHFQITRQGEHWVIIPTSNARYAARLLDATGRIIQQIRSRGIIELVTTDLPVGAYLVVIEDPSTRIVRRLVKVE